MTLEKTMMTTNLKYCFLLFFSSLSTANAQEMKHSILLDSIRNNLSLRMDSTWLIRQETLAEQVEGVFLFGFKNNDICVSNFYFDPFKKTIKVDSLFCIGKQENKEIVLSVLHNHLKYARIQPLNMLSRRPSNLRIIFYTFKDKYQYYSNNADLVFFDKTMRVVMHDHYARTTYSESSMKKKRRK
jgi:hypothetical protein